MKLHHTELKMLINRQLVLCDLPSCNLSLPALEKQGKKVGQNDFFIFIFIFYYFLGGGRGLSIAVFPPSASLPLALYLTRNVYQLQRRTGELVLVHRRV